MSNAINTKVLKPYQRNIAERYAAIGRTVVVRRAAGKLRISLNGHASICVEDAVSVMAYELGKIARELRSVV